MNQPVTAPPLRPVTFEFSGKGGEFFRIWIVNLCLSILTLGIYSAWAKVRTQQYFYGHTTVDGSSFEYTAQPMQILKGRLIAFGLFVLYQLTVEIMPLLGLPLLLLFAALLPWVIARSMLFRCYNTRYRHIRFGFSGRYRDAFIAYVLLPVGSLFTLGLLYPYAVCKQQRWLANNARFGDQPFQAELQAGAFYSTYIAAFMLIISTALIVWMVQTVAPPIAPFLPLLMAPFYYLAYVYITVKVTNYTLNNTTLGPHKLQSRLDTLAYFAIWLTNTLAIILTLGLAIPWAMVRTAQYRAECTRILIQGDLDHFLQQQQEQQNALGEELGEVFDLELGV
jgi:uncharacterized membrane protein YjgN (DUF898 family)